MTRLQKQLSNQGYMVAYINAWEDDHAEDPLLAVIAEIDEVMKPHIAKNKKWKKRWSTVKKSGLEVIYTGVKYAAIQASKKILGEGLDEISDILEGDKEASSAETSEATKPPKSEENDHSKEAGILLKPIDKKLEGLLDDFRSQKQSGQSFRENLQKFLELVEEKKSTKLPFFILIDELDRCRPTHAVEMLERIKHLFNIHNIVFVLATDTSQLRHVVRGVYGGDFDSTRYLLRFFDRTYMFMEADKEQFVKHLFESHDIDDERLCSPMDIDNTEFFTKMMTYFDLGLRDIEQCFDMFHDFYTSWIYWNDTIKLQIHLAYLLPLICTHHQRDDEFFDYLIKSYNELRQDEIELRHKKLSRKNHKVQYTSVTYEHGQHDGRGVKRSAFIEISEIILSYLIAIHTSLEESSKTQNDNWNFDSWLAPKFQAENQFLHNRMWDPRNPKQTILLQYPNLVKSAGRLTYKPSETQ